MNSSMCLFLALACVFEIPLALSSHLVIGEPTLSLVTPSNYTEMMKTKCEVSYDFHGGYVIKMNTYFKICICQTREMT